MPEPTAVEAPPALINALFASDDPLNSSVVDQQSGTPLFEIATKFVFDTPGYKSKTTISNPDGVEVAAWEKPFKREQDRVTYHNDVRPIAEWLPKKKVLSRTRILTAPGGKTYHWKEDSSWGSNELKLIDPQTKHVFAHARTIRTGTGLILKKRRLVVSVEPEVASVLDAILLSVIIMDQMRHDRNLESHARASLGAAQGAQATMIGAGISSGHATG